MACTWCDHMLCVYTDVCKNSSCFGRCNTYDFSLNFRDEEDVDEDGSDVEYEPGLCAPSLNTTTKGSETSVLQNSLQCFGVSTASGWTYFKDVAPIQDGEFYSPAPPLPLSPTPTPPTPKAPLLQKLHPTTKPSPPMSWAPTSAPASAPASVPVSAPASTPTIPYAPPTLDGNVKETPSVTEALPHTILPWSTIGIDKGLLNSVPLSSLDEFPLYPHLPPFQRSIFRMGKASFSWPLGNITVYEGKRELVMEKPGKFVFDMDKGAKERASALPLKKIKKARRVKCVGGHSFTHKKSSKFSRETTPPSLIGSQSSRLRSQASTPKSLRW